MLLIKLKITLHGYQEFYSEKWMKTKKPFVVFLSYIKSYRNNAPQDFFLPPVSILINIFIFESLLLFVYKPTAPCLG